MGEDLRVPGSDGAPVRFRYNGRPAEGREGDTVASALHAAGERVLARSVRYHRPRGYFCGIGKCASCLVRVDGEPNVRACVTPLQEDMRVESQNAWPSAKRDVLGVIDRVFPRNFDYHDKFTRPRFMAPVFNAVVRRMAGFGDPPDPAARVERPPMRSASVDVAVVGAGPAGLSAAAEAAWAGATVALVEERHELGGELLTHPGPLPPEAREWAGRPGPDVAADLAARLGAADRVTIHRPAVALGIYTDTGAPLVPVDAPGGVVEVRPQRVVVAAGSYEAPLAIPNNDLPGVMGARAAQLLLRQGVQPGKRAVIAGANGLGHRLAGELLDAGVEVAAIAAAPDAPGPGDARRVVAAHGGRTLRAVTLDGPGGAERVACDALVVAAGRYPRPELLQQAGVPAGGATANGALLPRAASDGATPVPWCFVAGDAAGPKPVSLSLAQGRLAGLTAARSLGLGKDADDRLEALRRRVAALWGVDGA